MAGPLDHCPDRRGGDSLKWNRWAGRDVIPLWVADLDCPAAPPVVEAVRACCDRGVFGYPVPPPGLAETACEHLRRRHGWAVEPDWLVWIANLVAGIHAACRVGDGPAATTVPIYPPFLSVPAGLGQEVRRVPMTWRDRWEHDTAAMAAACRGAGTALLCLPHNPLGRVCDGDELAALAPAVAGARVVVSDEAHADLVLDPGCRHVPLAVAAPGLAPRLIALYSAAKAFNLPGLACGLAVIPDAGLRQRFRAAVQTASAHPSLPGLHATHAAWRDGWTWHAALLAQLREHRDRAVARLRALPGLAVQAPQATYLVWLDARGLGVADPFRHLLAHGVGLSDGAEFGAPGHLRLNLGCRSALLDEALERIARAAAAAGGAA